ncbi:hypothetical protein LTR17_023241 [Elasticomyces elasticus]|nr:hypothetical protein LTR17_023241 [Elasticomyces elasticus]
MFCFPGVKLCTVKGPMGCIVRKFATPKELGKADEEEDEEIWGVPFSSGIDSDDGSVRENDEARRKVSEKEPSVKKVQRRIGLGDAWRHQVKALNDRTARELLRVAAASSDVVLQQVREKMIADCSMPPAKKSKRADGTAQECLDEPTAVEITSQVPKIAPTAPKTSMSISSKKRTSSEDNEEASAVDTLDTKSVYDLLFNASKIVPAIHKLGKAKFEEVNKAKRGLRDSKGYIEDSAMLFKQLEDATTLCTGSKTIPRSLGEAKGKPVQAGLSDCSVNVLALTAVVHRTQEQVTAASSWGTKRKSLKGLCEICDLVNNACGAREQSNAAWEARNQMRVGGVLADAMFHVLEIMTMKEINEIRKDDKVVMLMWRKTLGRDDFGVTEVFSRLEDTQTDGWCETCDRRCGVQYTGLEHIRDDSEPPDPTSEDESGSQDESLDLQSPGGTSEDDRDAEIGRFPSPFSEFD